MRGDDLRCAATNDAAIVDTIGAAASFGLVTYGAFILADSGHCPSGQFCELKKEIDQGAGGVAVAVGLVTGIVFAASAAYGFYDAGRCRERARVTKSAR